MPGYCTICHADGSIGIVEVEDEKIFTALVESKPLPSVKKFRHYIVDPEHPPIVIGIFNRGSKEAKFLSLIRRLDEFDERCEGSFSDALGSIMISAMLNSISTEDLEKLLFHVYGDQTRR